MQDDRVIFGSLLLLGLFGTAYFVRGRLYASIDKIWDESTQKKIRELDPIIRQKATRFILDMQRKGINLRIPAEMGGCRSAQQQNALYWQGRDPYLPGPIVTDARAGQSLHEYCLAFDVVEINSLGQPLWENPNWDLIAETGQKYGLLWGGPGDKGHFYSLDKGDWPELQAAVTAGNVDEFGYVIT